MKAKGTIQSVLAAGMLALGLIGSLGAHASVVVGATRVIFNSQDSEATVKMSNEGKLPALVQSWVDTGNAKETPSSIEVPFTIMPPAARIDPAKAQTLRILYTGEPLPQDKESVFWLNVLEVPPKPTGELADVNKLQLAFRTRIKLFYRPAGLKGAAADAPAQLSWRITQSAKTPAIEARNPTPYYVSFASLEVSAGGKTLKNDDGGMVPPGASAVFPLVGEGIPAGGAKVHYRAISDWGGPIDGEAPLSAAN
ncbi:periplasmic pilin chaperone [Paraburkholderia piptadeniae]|uniref:Periplasmic pilin chaperone n=1 Tax=Paraburkholderia piptadeniae TaxID=1701573 RepID=A0A1N7S282_9BURK|nr:fimbria/pilus periplasmic chaperone [Paraburkholderia piptadeniae]SIT41087.1 periplasmic pilin chaperone [Paraburkholderia piptadeniae]